MKYFLMILIGLIMGCASPKGPHVTEVLAELTKKHGEPVKREPVYIYAYGNKFLDKWVYTFKTQKGETITVTRDARVVPMNINSNAPRGPAWIPYTISRQPNLVNSEDYPLDPILKAGIIKKLSFGNQPPSKEKFNGLKSLNTTIVPFDDLPLKSVAGLENFTKLERLSIEWDLLATATNWEKLTNLKAVHVTGPQPTSIETLRKLPNLEILNLYAQDLPADVKELGLENLKNLRVLTITCGRDGDKLKDVKGLENLTNLRVLGLSSHGLSDVKALENLTNLERLDLSFNELSDLNGLENLTNLRELKLQGNNLTDVKALENLLNLEVLWLGGLLTDVNDLKNLTNLREFRHHGGSLRDVNGLKNLTNLEILDIRDNNLRDVSSLKNLTNLKDLSLVRNPLTWRQVKDLPGIPKKTVSRGGIDFQVSLDPSRGHGFTLDDEDSAKEIEDRIRRRINKPTGELTRTDYERITDLTINSRRLGTVIGLEKLPNLKNLYLENNQLTDVNGLKNLTNLERLLLGGNNLTDVNGLKDLPNLKTLGLSGNDLANLQGLENLTNLQLLILRDNKRLSKKQVAELQKALPKCEIHFPPYFPEKYFTK